MKKKTTISLCMISLNEEAFIGRALKNVSPYVDEIIVVDGGSTDKTVKIAKEFGARVFYKKWANDFAKQRNYSLKKATKDWILVMDCDEYYEKKLLADLIYLTKNNLDLDVFLFARKNYIDGKLTENYPDRQFRFFKNNRKIKYVYKVHEVPIGWRRVAFISDYHIIHRKTSVRQNQQNHYYEGLEKLGK